MPAVRPSPSAARRRWFALVGTGAFILIAGALMPQIIATPGLRTTPADEIPSATTTAPAAGELIPAEIRPTLNRVLIIASVVTLLGVGLIWLAKRRGQAEAVEAPSLLNITAALPLPYHCCAYLIRVGDRQFLAGVDAHGIRNVISLPAPPADDDDDAAVATPDSLPTPVRVIA